MIVLCVSFPLSAMLSLLLILLERGGLGNPTAAGDLRCGHRCGVTACGPWAAGTTLCFHVCNYRAVSFPLLIWVNFSALCSLYTKIFLELSS